MCKVIRQFADTDRRGCDRECQEGDREWQSTGRTPGQSGRTKPASCIWILTRSSDSLLKMTWTTGIFRCAWVSRSPRPSIVKPPSPHSAIDCRPGNASCAPNALGAAFAIEAQEKEPKRRRL